MNKDPLSELLSAARNQTETKLEQSCAPALPASTSSRDPTPDNRTEVECESKRLILSEKVIMEV